MISNYESCSCSRPTRQNCTSCERGMAVLVGVLGGIVLAALGVILYISGLITLLAPAVLTALIAGLVYLLTLIVLPAMGESCGKISACIGCHLGSIMFGVLGTIFAGLIAVSADLTTVGVFTGIIVGLVLFFFAYMIITALFLVRCFTGVDE